MQRGIQLSRSQCGEPPDSQEALATDAINYPVSARLGAREVLKSGFDLDGTSPDGLQITVGNRMCRLIGKLLDATGKPVAGARVVIFSDLPASTAVTDADGTFHLAPRPAGQYHFSVLGDADDFSVLNDPDYLKAHESDFPPVTLVQGENPPLTLRLPVH